MNPYEILGVSEHTSKEEVRRVFLEYARKFHPDTAKTEEERREKESKFKEITYAYNLIKNSDNFNRVSNTTESSSEDDNILIKKAHVLISKGDYNSALEILRQLKGQDGYEINMLKGLSFFRKKRYHEALKYYKKAVDFNPWNPDVYTSIAEVYENINLKETAKKFYLKALEIDSNHVKASKGLERIKDTESGFSIFKKIIKG